jgi:hypothetical protein
MVTKAQNSPQWLVEAVMDTREILERLKSELGDLEYGRTRRSVHMPWEELSFFQDSATCLNAGLEGRPHPCGNCMLMAWVPRIPEAKLFLAITFLWTTRETPSKIWIGDTIGTALRSR